MSDNQSKQKHECKCEGAKEVKALKKQVADFAIELAELRKQIEILRKAVRK